MPNQTRKSLTDMVIKAQAPPSSGTVTIWDDSLKGFGLRVSQGGTRTFVVLIGSGRRQSIGHYPLISLSVARTEAKRILAEKTLGKVRPTHTAYADALEEFLEACAQKNRPSTAVEYRRLLNRHYPYGRTSVGALQSRDIQRRLAKLAATPAERLAAFRAGRAFFRWCVRQRIIDRSPLELVAPPPGSPSRERTLADAELFAVFKMASEGGSTYHRIVTLIALLGQRRGEIAALEWSWINQAERTITFPGRITKNKRTHVLPYGELTAAVLGAVPRIHGSPFVFPAVRNGKAGKQATIFNGWSKPKAEFDQALKAAAFEVEPWRLHDLRRTLSTTMPALKVPQEITDRILNHVSGGNGSQVSKIYNRYAYLEEKRDAIERWERHLINILDGTKSAA